MQGRQPFCGSQCQNSMNWTILTSAVTNLLDCCRHAIHLLGSFLVVFMLSPFPQSPCSGFRNASNNYKDSCISITRSRKQLHSHTQILRALKEVHCLGMVHSLQFQDSNIYLKISTKLQALVSFNVAFPPPQSLHTHRHL